MRLFLICILLSFSIMPLSAHKSWKMHAQDMYEVLQMDENELLTLWMKYVSSELIDGYEVKHVYKKDGVEMNFGAFLRDKYEGLSFPHRYLYHWGFNSVPWTIDWEKKVENWEESLIDSLKNDLIKEQKRRNGIANNITETLFHYGHKGKEARIANVILSIVYDTHILGDYEPDNMRLEGLQDVSSVVSDLINRIRALDKKAGNNLIKEFKRISNDTTINVQEKALLLNVALKRDFSKVLQAADNGDVKAHLESIGFKFKSMKIRESTITEADVIINTNCRDDNEEFKKIRGDTLVSKVQPSPRQSTGSVEKENGTHTVIITYIVVLIVLLGLLLICAKKK